MKKLWFKRKPYGWGWTPASFEGHVVTMVCLLAVIAIFIWVKSFVLLQCLLVAVIGIFIIICYNTGEPPKWQWGEPKK